MSKGVIIKGPFLLRWIEETHEGSIPEVMLIDGMVVIADSVGGTISLSHEELINLVLFHGPRILESMEN